MTHKDRRPQRFNDRRRWSICLLLFCALGLQFVPPSQRPAAAADSAAGAAPAGRKAATPAQNFPDLNELRGRRVESTRAVPPVPSTLRSCPAGDRLCRDVSAGSARPAGAGRGAAATLAGRSFLALAAVAFNGGPPAFGLSLLDYFSDGGGHSVSDAPGFRLPLAAALLLDAPTDLRVVASADDHIDLAWSSTAGATKYRVERGASKDEIPLPVGTPTSPEFSNVGLTRGHSYLYRVCAADGAGACVSPYSNTAMGTAYSFADDPLVTIAEDPSGATVTKVSALHFTQLREAVNSVRHLAGRGDASWTNPTLTPGQSLVKADDVRDLRSRLGEALADLGLDAPGYVDPTIYTQQDVGHSPTVIKRAHVAELRLAATRGRGNGSGPNGSFDFNTTRLDPSNRTGEAGADLYSRNYNWGVQLLKLPGRAALNLGLTLSYNSLVWTKDATNSAMTFDADRGFPAPGFRLGFPKIQPAFLNSQTGKVTYLLVTPSGGRVELRQTDQPGLYESADSSYLQLKENGGGLELTSTDGTRLSFAPSGGEYVCVEVRDRNGNYISVGYAAGRLDNVIDTLGRRVTFHYDAGGHLQEIRQVWKRERVENSDPPDETHVWATFGYGEPQTLGPNASLFAGLTVAGTQGGTPVAVLRRVGLSDGSYYGFEYNQWGQVWKITHYAADARNAQGDPDYSHALASTWLDLPGAGPSTGGAAGPPALPQSHCPRFTQERQWVRNGVMNADGEAVTGFDPWSPNMASCDALSPDGKVRTTETYATSGWRKGMVTQSEVWAPNESTGVWERKKWTTVGVEHDGAQDAPFPTNPRVNDTTISDPGSSRRTHVNFTATFGLPREVIEYKSDATTPLRTTVTEYATSSASQYTDRRIIGLASARFLYEGAASAPNLRSKTEFFYDDAGHVNGDTSQPKYLQVHTSPAAQHYVGDYGESFRWRGNLTRRRRYEVNPASGAVSGSFTEARMGYNVTGGIAFADDAAGHRTTFNYADAFYKNVNRTHTDPLLKLQTFAYPTTITDPDGFEGSTWYNYDMGAVTRVRTPKPNELTDGSGGPEVFRLYDEAGRPLRETNSVNAARTRWVYPLRMDAVERLTLVEAGKESYAAELLDGAGRVRATVSFLPPPEDAGTGTYAGNFSAQMSDFDEMGRRVRETNPTEITAAWEFVAGGWVYTRQSYDWKGRPRVTTRETDNTTVVVDYGGCGCAGGDVITSSGEEVMLPPQSGAGAWTLGRRTRRSHRDVLGREVRNEVLKRDGSPYMTTVTDYNASDQITAVRQYRGAAAEDGSCPTQTCQQTAVTYDGYGRLLTRRLPEQTAPTHYTYNADDTPAVVTDPRGATSTYTYLNNRRLVSSIVYGEPFGVSQAATVSFTYDAAGNRKTQTDKGGTITFGYDLLSRVASETRAFTSLPGEEYTLQYTYNLAGQLSTLTYPDDKVVSYEYNRAGSLKAVTDGAGTQYASGMRYNATGALREVSYGNGERMTLDYDARQRVKKYRVWSPGAQPGADDAALSEYDYEADGRVKNAFDRTDPNFDRSYLYDLVGRLVDSHTSSSAFFQSYAYDEFGHMTYRGNGSWRFYENTFSQYRNNRNISTQTGPPTYPSCCPPPTVVWQYDAAGNVTGDHNKEYTYDAAGNRARVSETTQDGATLTKRLWIYQDYDASGQRVKRVEQNQINNSPYTFQTSFYVRSSVLENKVVEELNANGVKSKAYVYANGTLLAEEENSQLTWAHIDPVTGSRRVTDADGSLAERAEFDPLGNGAPLNDPSPPEVTPDYEYTANYNGGGNAYDSSSGCLVDGQPMSCSSAMRLIHFGRPTAMSAAQEGLVGGGFSGSHVWVDEWDDYFIPSDPNQPLDPNKPYDGGITGTRNVGRFVFVREGAAPPVNTVPIVIKTMLTSEQVDQIGKDLEKLLAGNEKCRKFVEAMLTAAGDKANNKPTTTDMVKFFNIIANQLGFAFGTELRPGRGTTGRLGYSGVYSTGGYSQVLLSSNLPTNQSTPEKVREEMVYTTLGELTHLAGEKKYGRTMPYHGSIGYGDNALLQAGASVAQPLDVPVPANIPDPNKDQINYSSRLYHQMLERACGRKL